MRGIVTLLTPDVHARLVECVRGGNFITTAAAVGGVAAPGRCR